MGVGGDGVSLEEKPGTEPSQDAGSKHGTSLVKKVLIALGCLLIGVPILLVLLIVLGSLARVGSSSEFTNVEITGQDGSTFGAYYKAPAACSESDPCPVSLVLHEWGGLNEDLIQLAEHLVETAGVAVLVPDLFRGTSSPTTNIFYNIYRVSNADQGQMDKDAEAALDWVTAKPEIDASRVISGPGFCFGGSQSLIFATRHNISATITLYGSNIDSLAAADDAQWGYLGAGHPLLGIYGEEDQRPAPAHVEAFEKRLEERGVAAEIHMYKGVGHAFVSMAAIDDPKMDDGKSEAAWAVIVEFLGRVVPKRRLAAEGDEALLEGGATLSARGPLSRGGWKPPTWRTNQFGRLLGIWANECAGE